MTITRVTVEPGATQERHAHASSEQTWIALSGSGTLLLGKEATRPISAGDVVRFPETEIHGLANTGTAPFVYVAVTAPPIDFSPAYQVADSR